MSIYMASFGYELLAALQEILDEFEEAGEGGDRVAIITGEQFDEFDALITRGMSS